MCVGPRLPRASSPVANHRTPTTTNPESEYSVSRVWAQFRVDPRNASGTTGMRDRSRLHIGSTLIPFKYRTKSITRLGATKQKAQRPRRVEPVIYYKNSDLVADRATNFIRIPVLSGFRNPGMPNGGISDAPPAPPPSQIAAHDKTPRRGSAPGCWEIAGSGWLPT
jgi:hypothetical protein